MTWPGHELLLTLLYAVICMFCALLASTALALPAPGRPLLQVIAGTLPVAVAALALFRQGGFDPAATVLTASAATLAIFVNGAIVLITPRPGNQAPAAQSPAASIILPIALVLILAGFSVHLTAATCIGLGLLAMLCVDLARGIPSIPGQLPPAASPRFVWPLCVLAGILALALLFFATGQLWHTTHTPHLTRVRDLAIVNLLCPALLLSILRQTLRVAHDHSPADALSMSSAAIGIIIGLVLPALCLLDYLLRHQADEAALLAGLPQLSWRLDAPMLAAGGFALIAMRLDVIRPHRWVGLLLIVLYAAYLLTGSVLRLF